MRQLRVGKVTLPLAELEAINPGAPFKLLGPVARVAGVQLEDGIFTFTIIYNDGMVEEHARDLARWEKSLAEAENRLAEDPDSVPARISLGSIRDRKPELASKPLQYFRMGDAPIDAPLLNTNLGVCGRYVFFWDAPSQGLFGLF